MSDTRRYVYDPIQGQGHGGPKIVKMADFKSLYTLPIASN